MDYSMFHSEVRVRRADEDNLDDVAVAPFSVKGDMGKYGLLALLLFLRCFGSDGSENDDEFDDNHPDDTKRLKLTEKNLRLLYPDNSKLFPYIPTPDPDNWRLYPDTNKMLRAKRQVVRAKVTERTERAERKAPSEKKAKPTHRSDRLTEQDVITKILTNYNWRVRPKGLNTSSNSDTGGPVIVIVNIYLRSISKIDDVNMEYSAQFTFREEWLDQRLAFKQFFKANDSIPYVILAQGQAIWMPDTFFQNEKEARKHEIDKPNVLIRIHPDGKVLYSVRLSLVLSCPMDLGYYPLDNQTCFVDLASYAYTTEDIKYDWKPKDPVQQKPGLERSLPSFKLEKVNVDYCTSVTATGEYSCLRTILVLRREFSYYLLQLYIPSFMLVIVSWVSFWLDKDSVPARVTLGVTTLLTMTTQASGVNAKLPPVSYTKAIDVWIGVCLAFIFGALLEFALVNYAARKDVMRNVGAMRRAPARKKTNASQGGIEFVDSGDEQQISYNTFPTNQNVGHNNSNALVQNANNAKSGSRRRGCLETWLFRYKERSKRIDVMSRVIFPCGFFFFNCIYWVFMLVCVSWVNFWIDKDSVPARVSLGVTTLLTMTTQASGVNAKLPPVSYTKAIDVWIGTCLGFIFCALLEFALVNYAGRMEFLEKEKKKQKVTMGTAPPPPLRPPTDIFAPDFNTQSAISDDLDLAKDEQSIGMSKMPRKSIQNGVKATGKPMSNCVRWLRVWSSKYKERSKRIDVISRLVFPVIFFFFNLVYWTYYMSKPKFSA